MNRNRNIARRLTNKEYKPYIVKSRRNSLLRRTANKILGRG